jgi:hypothetical protein
VIETLECPSISFTILGYTPFVSKSVVHGCLRSWKRMFGSPALLGSGLKWRDRRLVQSIGVPRVFGKTRPCSRREPFDPDRSAS